MSPCKHREEGADAARRSHPSFRDIWRSGTLILASDVCQGYTGQLATYERGINEINSYLGAKPFEQAKGLPGLPKDGSYTHNK